MRSRKKEGAVKPGRKQDKRSSRGVMFENEELRMRTIEINAEVDRGQSDLRKLKRENETLKQQVWTLRDEYDKLESFVKKMDGESDDEGDDDDDDDDEDDDELDKSFCRSKIDEEGEEEEEEEGNVETDNLENLQKVYSGKMRSVEYMRQAASLDSGGPSAGCSQAQCSGGSAGTSCSGPVDDLAEPGPVRVCVSGDNPAYVGVGDENSASQAEPLQALSSENFLSQTDHFNLDQLLDFASSFHYDRKRHLAEEPPLTMTLPQEERQSSPPKEAGRPDPGYSTVRRRSATVIEKLKTGTNSGALVKEVKQLSLCNDDATTSASVPISEAPESTRTTTVNYTHSSYFFSGPLDGSRSQSLGTGLNSAANVTRTSSSPAGPLYASSSASNIGTSSSLGAGLPFVSVYNPRMSLVRLNSIEPNTIMVSVADMPQLWDITTQEIIDELEQQADGTLMSIRGVRVVGRAAYISLGRRDALQQLLNHGLTVRGGKVPLIDITRESIVLALTGVPHYIADATLVILLAAFGVIIGELERRFYKGVDTGERFVRMKLKKHVKLPKYVTVGGCRIVLTVHGRDAPAQLHQPEWGSKVTTTSAPQPTSHASHIPHTSEAFHTDLTTPISPDSGQCSEPSSSDKSCERVEGRDAATAKTEGNSQTDSRLTTKTSSKTFSSRCIVNLKLPERPASTNPIPRPREGSAPREIGPSHGGGGLAVSTGTPVTPLAAGHLLRAGSLYRSSGPPSQASTGSNSPAGSRRISRLGLIDPRVPEPPRSRPNSVVFDEQPREAPPAPRALLTPQYSQHHGHGPPVSIGPLPLANGILRKASGSEQEALLPTSHKCTASIRNRLKIGRSMSYDAGKQKLAAEKEKKKLSKMESISENTINDDVSDITPLGAGAGARRDSEKSSVSANSKSSSNANKKKEPVIDLPWCGCWGNGCF